MRGSLFVLNVGLLRPVDPTVGKFLIEDVLAASASTARASPVPVHSSDKLEAGDLLISQVSDNLQHFSTITIEAEHFQVHKAWSVNTILEEEGSSSHASKQPLCILSVLPKMSLHIKLILSKYCKKFFCKKKIFKNIENV